MKTYTVGARVMCDFPFGGKPKGKCVEVIEPGNGRQACTGKIRVKLTETKGAYKKGEILELTAATAVPTPHLISPRLGEYFYRINVDYQWQ